MKPEKSIFRILLDSILSIESEEELEARHYANLQMTIAKDGIYTASGKFVPWPEDASESEIQSFKIDLNYSKYIAYAYFNKWTKMPAHLADAQYGIYASTRHNAIDYSSEVIANLDKEVGVLLSAEANDEGIYDPERNEMIPWPPDVPEWKKNYCKWFINFIKNIAESVLVNRRAEQNIQ